MDRFGHAVVRFRIPILIAAFLLMIPSVLGYIHTRTNYDILTYLPKDIETMKGQDILSKDFGTGAFSMVVVEGMKDKDIKILADKIGKVDHVKRVIWYGSLLDESVPKELLPDRLKDSIVEGDSQLMIVLFDTTLSADETLEGIEEIRRVAGKQVFLSGMSAIVIDTKNLSDREVPVYVCIAVALSVIILTLAMDSFLIPLFFLLSIGMAIVYNLGSNFMAGEISYVTKALAAVLQLAVTMDYSIFLWHSYCDMKKEYEDKKEAMAHAINQTLVSVLGSSITTVAGFVALCFMSFTLGLDLGIVMAKGVVMGVICCVTILPSMILVFDKAIVKTSHRSLLPDFSKLAEWIVNHYYISILLFMLLIVPAFYGQSHNKVYYNLDSSLPEYLDSIQSNKKLEDTFHMNSTHLLLIDSKLRDKDVRKMIKEINGVKGVKTTIGLQSLVGAGFPKEMIPQKFIDIVDDGEYQLLFVMSEYKVASDEVNRQCDEINEILDRYDEKGMLIGEAPCTQDLIKITDKDFKTVNSVSILLVALIIAVVFKSVTLPVLLIAVIEFAIFINMGIPHYTGAVLPFIASIVIGTIQLGSTVDYAILMTNKYKDSRLGGADKKTAVTEALKSSMTSIIVSALSFFAATIGVGLYSEIDMIGSLCILMSRGAVISMFVVILLLPAVLRVFDAVIIRTTLGFSEIKRKQRLERRGA